MHVITTAISLDVIVRAVFGIADEGRRDRAASIVKKDVEAVVPSILFLPPLRHGFLGIGPWARFARARTDLDELLYAEIGAKRDPKNRGEDILSLILAAKYDDGTAMSDAEVRELLGRPPARHRQVLARRAQVLAYGEDVDTPFGHLAEAVEEFGDVFAESDHYSRFRYRVRIDLLRVAKQVKRAREVGAGAGRT